MFLFHAYKMILALYLIKMCGHVTITDDNTDDQLLKYTTQNIVEML